MAVQSESDSVLVIGAGVTLIEALAAAENLASEVRIINANIQSNFLFF